MASARTVLAIGDLLRDRFVESRVRRVSPESPNFIIEETPNTIEVAGGVGIGASVLQRMGQTVILASSWGDDDEALLQSTLGSAHRINLCPGRVAPTKTRYAEGSNILARVDSQPGQSCDWSNSSIKALEDSLETADAILVADYGQNAALAVPAVNGLIRECSRSTPAIWDYHPRSEIGPPAGAWVKFNEADFRLVRGLTADNSDLVELAQRILVTRSWRGILITRGSGGASLVTTSGVFVIPTMPLNLRSAIGAGDIVSALWASWAEVLAHREAAESAIRVASLALAVREGVLHQWSGGVDAGELAVAARIAGRRVVATAGCFDVLHAGHIDLLESARRHGDVLIVLLNSDRSVAELKGTGRPVCSVDDRVRALSSLRSVDAVVVFDESTPEQVLQRLRPDVYVKGGDYSMESLVEAASLQEVGAEIHIVPRTRPVSTSSILAGGTR